MARKENLFLWFSTMVFAVASVFFAWHFFHQKMIVLTALVT